LLIGGEGVSDAGRIGGAGEDGVDSGEGYGDGALDWWGEAVRKGEGLGVDGDEEPALGNVNVELMAEAQEERGRAGVRDYGVGFAGVGANGFAVDEAGGEAGGGVEEDG
jgi:hypothetical protein